MIPEKSGKHVIFDRPPDISDFRQNFHRGNKKYKCDYETIL